MVLKTIAVTGASGMLGRHIVAALEFSGFDVAPCSRTASGREPCRCWDLLQWKTEEEFDVLFESVDAVIHAGAAVPRGQHLCGDNELFDANVRATLNLANWARKRELPMVYISGGIVYADPNSQLIREDAPLGWSGLGGFYGLTKLLAEDLLCREKSAGLRLAVLRPSSIYGHGLSADKLICSFLRKAGEGGDIELKEPVADSVDLIHAADVADAVVRILQHAIWDTFNLASGCSTSFHDLAQACISVVGKGGVRVERGAQEPRPPIRRFGLDCELAGTRLGWSARVGLQDGIRAIFEQKVIVVGKT